MLESKNGGAAVLKRIRLGSGLVLFLYVGTHLLTLALGLGSLDALDVGRDIFIGFWRGWVGIVLLYGALLTHLSLVLYTLYQRRSLRLKPLEYTQVLLGLTIPFLLVEHALGTRMLEFLYGVDDDYIYIVLVLWVFSPELGILQNILLVVAWVHGCIGMHFWLKLKPCFPRFSLVLFMFAVLLPVAAIFGFVATGREVALLAEQPGWLDEMSKTLNLPGEDAVALVKHWTVIGRAIMGGMIAFVMLARIVRTLIEWRRRRVVLSYANGRKVEIVPGLSVLEASREAGIPHASVCGGRGRCSTCRVRCGRGIEHLAPPSPDEARVLLRVGAPDGVRLACQIRPTHGLEITPLLPPPLASGPRRRGSSRPIIKATSAKSASCSPISARSPISPRPNCPMTWCSFSTAISARWARRSTAPGARSTNSSAMA